MTVLFWILAISSSVLSMTAAFAFLRAKDLSTMGNVVMISNCYILPLVLLATALENFSLQPFIKIFFLIILNLIITNLLCHLILKKASE